jgi:hypothetical protein
MRFQLVGVSLLFTTTAIARVALTSNLLRGDSVVDRKPYVTAADHVSFLRDEPATGVISTGSEWNEAVLSGGNLWAGMHSDDRKASFLYRTDPHTRDPMLQTMQSEHDGDMKELWEKWGYNEDKEENAKIDKECDFEVYHKLKRAFDELGIKTQSKGKGGPNQCVQVDHKDGPKVIRDKGGTVPPLDQQKYIDENCGKEYRVSWKGVVCLAASTKFLVDYCGHFSVWSECGRRNFDPHQRHQPRIQCGKTVGKKAYSR